MSEKSPSTDHRAAVGEPDLEECHHIIRMACEHVFLFWDTPIVFSAFGLMSAMRREMRARIAAAGVKIH